MANHHYGDAAERERRRGDFESMSNVNIRRAVDNIRAGTTSIYTPVIELIVNGIQAIADNSAQKSGEINVTIIRGGPEDMIERIRAVEGFAVADNGIGFDSDNREAFDTFFTDNKALEGGKCLPRRRLCPTANFCHGVRKRHHHQRGGCSDYDWPDGIENHACRHPIGQIP
jgi:hypothetical protein